MEPLTIIRRDEIVGRRILAVTAHSWTAEGLDYDHTYLHLDNDIILSPPHADSLSHRTEPVPEATPVSADFVAKISPQCITAMHVLQDEDGWIDPLSLLIELSNGDILTHSCVEPHGTGMAGLRLYPQGCFDLARYRDYWLMNREPQTPE